MGFGPLQVINDNSIASGRGFGMRPQHDIEIITVIVDRELTHAELLRPL